MEETLRTVAVWQLIAAVVIFIACYVLIVSEKVDRSLVAICGALLVIILGIVDFHDSYVKYIHWETLFLLLGMMMLIGIASRSGIFQYIAIRTAQSAGGNPVRILVRLAILSAAASAFIDNITMVLLIVPITIAIAELLHISPTPFLITQIFAINLGGGATLVGDPSNIIIGTAASLSFNDFLLHLTPIMLVLIILTILFAMFYFKKNLNIKDKYKDTLMDTDPSDYIADSALAKKSVVIFILTLIGFLTHQYLNLEPAVVALTGSASLMLIGTSRKDMLEIYHSVEWVTIFFFSGLFVLVGGLVEVGIINKMATWMVSVTGDSIVLSSLSILWGIGILSSFVDNIPLVATMTPLIHDMCSQMTLAPSEVNTLWWSLALGVCLGANGTLIAASANLIVATLAARNDTPISFVDFLKISIMVAPVSLVIATIYVFLVFLKIGFA